MVAFPRRNLSHTRLVLGSALAGMLVGGTVLLLPAAALEALVWQSGIAALIPAAAPPLGATARVVLAFGLGALVFAIAWSALYLLLGPDGLLIRPERREDGVPVIRRADAHPDAPPRRPLFAAELNRAASWQEVAGAPATPPAPTDHGRRERGEDACCLPKDLDQPLASFDPAAVPAVPREPQPLVPPLSAAAKAAPTLLEGERIETFELTPMVRTAQPPAEPKPSPSIEALLRRLEESANRRAAGAH